VIRWQTLRTSFGSLRVTPRVCLGLLFSVVYKPPLIEIVPAPPRGRRIVTAPPPPVYRRSPAPAPGRYIALHGCSRLDGRGLQARALSLQPSVFPPPLPPPVVARVSLPARIAGEIPPPVSSAQSLIGPTGPTEKHPPTGIQSTAPERMAATCATPPSRRWGRRDGLQVLSISTATWRRSDRALEREKIGLHQTTPAAFSIPKARSAFVASHPRSFIRARTVGRWPPPKSR